MDKKKISVLACGWLGLPLAKSLLSDGHQVKGSTRSIEKISTLQEAGINDFLIDVTHIDAKKYSSFFKDSDVLIINIPPGRPVVEGRYAAYMQNIVPFIEQHTKVIFVSSTSVYSNTNDWVDEDSNLATTGSGKEIIAAEQCLKQELKERLSILRFAGLIGYDRMPGRFLAKKKDLKNANSPVNLIHRDDCIGLIHKIIENNSWGEIINGVADEHPLRKDFYTKAALLLKLTPPSFIEDADETFKIVSNKKSKRLLNFSYKFKNPCELL